MCPFPRVVVHRAVLHCQIAEPALFPRRVALLELGVAQLLEVAVEVHEDAVFSSFELGI